MDQARIERAYPISSGKRPSYGSNPLLALVASRRAHVAHWLSTYPEKEHVQVARDETRSAPRVRMRCHLVYLSTSGGTRTRLLGFHRASLQGDRISLPALPLSYRGSTLPGLATVGAGQRILSIPRSSR